MKWMKSIFLIGLGLLLVSQAYAEQQKKRIFVVSSYHKSYLWSQATQKGLTAAMLNYGYLNNIQQADDFTNNDYIESSKAIIKKVWMDTKHKNRFYEIAKTTVHIVRLIEEFKPDLVLLGDDNAANYIGNQLLDTSTPVVFWGINGLPLKYGLVESMDSPGHNVTGVWQVGYPKESLELLHQLIPQAKTFAILACDSETTRPRVKQIRNLARKGELPLKLADAIVTNSFSNFKTKAIELAAKVDAFFILNHDTLIDDQGNHMDMLDVGKWYLKNVKKPEASPEPQFVREGMLLTASDSGYNQSYRAFEMALDILEQGLNPSRMRTVVPPKGPLMVNRIRAETLGISLEDKMDAIDEIVDESIALER
ncbi:ABC transporter substrate binding protein [Desulfococcaceae bacterium HSG9]|nr:ABC transporter substrate binding protein [Desulfococcaceae bacterium HSG9]